MSGKFQFLFVVTSQERIDSSDEESFSSFSLLHKEVFTAEFQFLLFQFLFVVTLYQNVMRHLPMFQFLFVVTIIKLRNTSLATCFSFFSLLLHLRLTFAREVDCFSFFSLLQTPRRCWLKVKNVLVSFRCYKFKLIFSLRGQNCFSFFSLLLDCLAKSNSQN